jgi:hypothetical protein
MMRETRQTALLVTYTLAYALFAIVSMANGYLKHSLVAFFVGGAFAIIALGFAVKVRRRVAHVDNS